MLTGPVPFVQFLLLNSIRRPVWKIAKPLFDNKFTSVFGFPSERAVTKVKDFLTEPTKEFIAESPFLVMATSSRDGECDASPKGGKPGFVRVLDDRHLLVPDVAGNKLFQSYQNMDENPYVGLLFFIPGFKRRGASQRASDDGHQGRPGPV